MKAIFCLVLLVCLAVDIHCKNTEVEEESYLFKHTKVHKLLDDQKTKHDKHDKHVKKELKPVTGKEGAAATVSASVASSAAAGAAAAAPSVESNEEVTLRPDLKLVHLNKANRKPARRELPAERPDDYRERSYYA